MANLTSTLQSASDNFSIPDSVTWPKTSPTVDTTVKASTGVAPAATTAKKRTAGTIVLPEKNPAFHTTEGGQADIYGL